MEVYNDKIQKEENANLLDWLYHVSKLLCFQDFHICIYKWLICAVVTHTKYLKRKEKKNNNNKRKRNINNKLYMFK